MRKRGARHRPLLAISPEEVVAINEDIDMEIDPIRSLALVLRENRGNYSHVPGTCSPKWTAARQ